MIQQISAASTPFTPRTPKQNAVYHGRLRDIALIENSNAAGESLWQAERELKAWSIGKAAEMVGRPIVSSTELSELEFERMNEWLATVIDAMRAGAKRPR